MFLSTFDKVGVLTTAAFALLAGCYGGHAPRPQTPSGEQSRYGPYDRDTSKTAVIVEMTAGDAFEPVAVTIQAGEAVLWNNVSGEPHTVTCDPEWVTNRDHVELPAEAKPFSSGNIPSGSTFRKVFKVPGTYRYVCSIHENKGMTGTVIVRP